MMNPELIAKIAQWRAKAAEGTLTREEMAQAIVLLREDRTSSISASSSAASRKKAIAVMPSADDLLAQLGDLL
jgi:hypothetical protein